MRSVTAPRRGTAGGFTLVELLVVIGIIALLIAILLPVLGKAKESANRAGCLSNLRQLGMAMHMYVQDNKGFFPRCAPRYSLEMLDHDWIFFRTRPDGRGLDASPILPYVNQKKFNERLFVCPSDDTSTRYKVYNGETYNYSYCMNGMLGGAITGFNQETFKVTRIPRSSEFVMLAEEDERSINDGAWCPGSDWLAIRHDRQRNLPDSRWQDNPECKGNVAFADGHGEYVTRSYAHDRTHWDPR